MNTKVVKALIKGVVAIAVAAIGVFGGMKYEQKNTQTQMTAGIIFQGKSLKI